MNSWCATSCLEFFSELGKISRSARDKVEPVHTESAYHIQTHLEIIHTHAAEAKKFIWSFL